MAEEKEPTVSGCLLHGKHDVKYLASTLIYIRLGGQHAEGAGLLSFHEGATFAQTS